MFRGTIMKIGIIFCEELVFKKTSQEDMSSYKCRNLVHFVGRESKVMLAICLF